MRAFQAPRVSELDGSTCSEPDCPRLVWANGFCNVHNQANKQPRPPSPFVVFRPYRRATVGNPRCAPVAPYAATQIVPEYQRFLDELGITYRQFDHWKRLKYLPRKPWYEIAKTPALRQRAEDLADASRLRAMTLPELADYLAQERGTDESI